MGIMKEMWFAQMERRMAELIDEGMPETAAYDAASEQAYDLLREDLADKADYLRKKAKEDAR